jgi:leucyl aminopeptidase (aminopeptidase T)
MLESQNVQERLLGAGQRVFIEAPERIEPLAHEIAKHRVTGCAGPVRPDAHSVRSLHRDLPDEHHVSHFEFGLFDRNGHLKVLVHALE